MQQPTRLEHRSVLAPARGALGALRRFTHPEAGTERCELCSLLLEGEHAHLLDPGERRILCTCQSCSILFPGQQGARFLRVPRRVVRLNRFAFSDAEWEAMMLPIQLAFFLHGALGSATAVYPSPAGAMESLISLAPWKELFAREPVVCDAEPEVVALIANRTGAQPSYFLAPIDQCYRLAGLVRSNWQGLSGGAGLRDAIAGFFLELGRRATDYPGQTGQVDLEFDPAGRGAGPDQGPDHGGSCRA
jgi:hypothetical protein